MHATYGCILRRGITIFLWGWNSWDVHQVLIIFFVYMKMKKKQGHPTTVSSKMFVRRAKYCLKFSITWGRLKICRWSFHSCTIFEAYQIYSLRLSEVQFFKLHSPLNVMERGIGKILTFVICYNGCKVFGKIILKPLQFRNDSNSPWMTEQIQILQHRLECISRDLKVLWKPKKCFNLFGRKLSWLPLKKVPSD